jgi:hypothetical protein
LGENDKKTWTEILPVWGALKTLLKPIWNCPTSWYTYIRVIKIDLSANLTIVTHA